MKDSFTLYDMIIKLIYKNMAFEEMPSFLCIDKVYLDYMLKKIRNDIIYYGDESEFHLVDKIDTLYNKNNKKLDLIGKNRIKDNVLKMIISGKNNDEIINELNISSMKYYALLKGLYFDIYMYGKEDSKFYLNFIKERINSFNIAINDSRKKDKIELTSSKEDMLVRDDNGHILNTFERFHQVSSILENVRKFIIISDTHFGSLFENFDYINYVYDYALKNNIKYIFHCGDLIEGNYRDYLRCPKEYKNIASQINHVVECFPFDDDIEVYIVFGNHDLNAFFEGYNLRSELKSRNDFNILGYRSAYVNINGEYIGFKHDVSRIVNHVVDEQTLISYHGHSHQYRCTYDSKNTIFKVPTLSSMRSNNLSVLNQGFLVTSLSDEVRTDYIDLKDNKSYTFIKRKKC